jgi:hypothetical protein
MPTQVRGDGARPEVCHAVAGVEGLEPPASGFGDRRSSQLSYTPTVRSPRSRGGGQGAVEERAGTEVKRAVPPGMVAGNVGALPGCLLALIAALDNARGCYGYP